MADQDRLLAQLTSRLDHLDGLEYDWDSHGGSPPAPPALRFVRGLLPDLAQVEHLVICPAGDGSVQIERHADGRDIEVYVEPDGSGGVWICHGSAENEVHYEQITRAHVLRAFGLEAQ